MFLGCQACQSNGGSCDKHPKVTCPDCGLQYIDDEDWSGPAHSDRACKYRMSRQITVYRSALEKVAQWDCLNMPDSPNGVSDLCSDFPWLKKLVDDALKAGDKK